MLRVFIPKERLPGETRVAATPETVKAMVKDCLQITVEAGAGAAAFISDGQFEEAGALISTDLHEAFGSADLVLKVAPPGKNEELGKNEAEALKPGAVLIGFLAPYRHLEMVRRLAFREVTSFAMELIPRISRAQRMDALSSQASVAGYKAVILAASHLGKYFPLLMTAAGTILPARILVIGAGVAGLQAIATAKRLGAVIEALDLRPAVREEVESLGAKFAQLLGQEGGEGSGEYATEIGPDILQKQQEMLGPYVTRADVVICTAQVPGRPSPKLVSADMVRNMRPGSIIVDLAVEQGGNCEVSELGKDVVHNGVLIIGHPNLAATVPMDASMLYSRNVLELVCHMVKDGRLNLNLDEEITREALLTYQGEVLHQPTAELLLKGDE